MKISKINKINFKQVAKKAGSHARRKKYDTISFFEKQIVLRFKRFKCVLKLRFPISLPIDALWRTISVADYLCFVHNSKIRPFPHSNAS
jgi:hypothetical protein